MSNSESSAHGPTHPDSSVTIRDNGFDFTDPNSPLAPFYFQASHVAAAVIFGTIFVFYSLVVRLHHTDIWMHLKYGEWIVEHGELPKTELFSLHSSEPVVNFQWMTQCLYYLLFRAGESLAGGTFEQQTAGGVEFLRSFHALITTIRFLVLLLAFRRLTGSLPLACVGIGILLALSFGTSAIQRPQAVGELFFAFLLYALSSPKLSNGSLIGLPLLFSLWVNCHGSFILGLSILAIFLIGRIAEAAQSPGGSGWRLAVGDAQVWRLLVALTASVVISGVLNPYGFGIFGKVGQLANNPNIATLQEWQPLNFSEPEGGHWAYLGLMILLVVSQTISPKSLGPTQILLLGTFGVFPLLQRRMMIWWVVLAIWIMLPLWWEMRRIIPSHLTSFSTVPSFRKTLLAGGILILALVWSGPVGWLVTGRPTPLSASVAPETPWRIPIHLNALRETAKRGEVEALREILDKNYGGQFRGGIFASDTLGDYLVWAIPETPTPVMVYTHAHLFPKHHWEDFTTVLSGRPGRSRVLDRYGMNLIVVEKEPDYLRQLIQKVTEHPDWLVIQGNGRLSNAIFVAIRKQPVLRSGKHQPQK